jgi:inhibitor of the pro-sigma K processing machinery
MTSLLVALFLIVAIIVIVWYLVKKLAVLLVNAVLGLLLLVVINFLHLMQWIGKPDLGYDAATILISALGGVPGVLILILLRLFGISV